MLGSTFSPALKEINKVNGTSHMQRPKKEAISVKVGVSTRSYLDFGYRDDKGEK
jgi:hypothetical protein